MLLAATFFFVGCICICMWGGVGLSQRFGVMCNFTLLGVSFFGIGFLVFFGFCLYKMLRQGTSAPAATPAKTHAAEVQPPEQEQPKGFGTDVADDKFRFVDRIPEYKVMLERWMETEKPFMNKDFKLLDVMQALPLNRSYLSRMFNEAYGETFFSFVMRYRIDESVRMLEFRPDLTVARIAQLCGFSSASVFGRAFLKNKGITPKESRKRKLSAA